jgi:hypothetical protein
MGPPKVDWSEFEPLYRANVLSVSEIARQFDVTVTAIRKHAEARPRCQSQGQDQRKTDRGSSR